MGVVGKVAFAFTALCLAFAAITLLSSTTLTFTAGSSSTVDCGSAAFPNSLEDFESADDAANCAGETSASLALYSVLLAVVGLAVIAGTWRSTVKQAGNEGRARRISHSS